MTVERGDGWELHLADCLDPERGLPSLESCDHVITDPPYSERTHSGVRTGAGRRDDLGAKTGADVRRRVELGFDHLSDGLREGVAKHVGRSTKRWALAFSDLESEHLWDEALCRHGMRSWRFGLWHRVNGAPQFNGCGPASAAEGIAICHSTAAMRWNGGGRHALWAHPTVLDRGHTGNVRVHTTQKPLPLMETLVREFTDPGELICDPFAGSGTTGVACIRLGRRFIGWERDPKYFAIAVKRLRAAREQLQIFPETTP